MKTYTIKLETYCENCPEFEVAVKSEEYTIENFFDNNGHEQIERIITCKHSRRCNNMWRNKFERMEENLG